MPKRRTPKGKYKLVQPASSSRTKEFFCKGCSNNVTAPKDTKFMECRNGRHFFWK